MSKVAISNLLKDMRTIQLSISNPYTFTKFLEDIKFMEPTETSNQYWIEIPYSLHDESLSLSDKQNLITLASRLKKLNQSAADYPFINDFIMASIELALLIMRGQYKTNTGTPAAKLSYLVNVVKQYEEVIEAVNSNNTAAKVEEKCNKLAEATVELHENLPINRFSNRVVATALLVTGVVLAVAAFACFSAAILGVGFFSAFLVASPMEISWIIAKVPLSIYGLALGGIVVGGGLGAGATVASCASFQTAWERNYEMKSSLKKLEKTSEKLQNHNEFGLFSRARQNGVELEAIGENRQGLVA